MEEDVSTLLEVLSSISVWDENDGPKVDSNASAEGNCAPGTVSVLFRGDNGSFEFIGPRGLFAIVAG